MLNIDEITNSIIQGDSLEVLKKFPDNFIHSVITSPPYYQQRDYNVDGQLGQEKTIEDYVNNLCNIFDEVKRTLRDDGTIFINIGDKYDQNGNLLNAPHRLAIELQNRGWILRNTIIWNKLGGLPESVKNRFSNTFEYIFMFTKQRNYFFEQVFEPYKSATLKRFQYGNNVKPESPYAHFQCENMGQRLGFNNQGRNKTNVWELPTSNFKGGHFAVMPLELIRTCLQTTPEKICKKCGKGLKKQYKEGKDLDEIKKHSGADSKGLYKGQSKKAHNENKVQNASDVKRRVLESMKERIFIGYEMCECQKDKNKYDKAIILDPFMGAGSVAISCMQNDRNYIGIELNPEYIKVAEERIKPFKQQLKFSF